MQLVESREACTDNECFDDIASIFRHRFHSVSQRDDWGPCCFEHGGLLQRGQQNQRAGTMTDCGNDDRSACPSSCIPTPHWIFLVLLT
jgi:hypothetical protein